MSDKHWVVFEELVDRSLKLSIKFLAKLKNQVKDGPLRHSTNIWSSILLLVGKVLSFHGYVERSHVISTIWITRERWDFQLVHLTNFVPIIVFVRGVFCIVVTTFYLKSQTRYLLDLWSDVLTVLWRTVICWVDVWGSLTYKIVCLKESPSCSQDPLHLKQVAWKWRLGYVHTHWLFFCDVLSIKTFHQVFQHGHHNGEFRCRHGNSHAGEIIYILLWFFFALLSNST